MIAWWVSVLFRLANFGVCIAFVVYGYYRYAKGHIDAAMEHEEHIMDGLLKERDVVMRIESEYKDLVAQKQAQRIRMQETIKQWSDVVAHEKSHRLLEKKNREIILKHKAVQQAELLRTLAITQAVVPGAVVQARRELVQEFSNEQEGADFVQRIIARMQENKS